MVERIRRANRRSQLRLAFSPDVAFSPDASKFHKSPVIASPAPMQRALGAFMCSSSDAHTHTALASACFFAWRDTCHQAKQLTGAAMWVMERMAMSQDPLVLQAVFTSWCRLADQNRLPLWAQELQNNVRFLRKVQEPTSPQGFFAPSSTGRNESSGAWWTSWVIPVLVCIASLFVHMFLLAVQHGIPVKDSDGDGIADSSDFCPASAIVVDKNGCTAAQKGIPARTDSDESGWQSAVGLLRGSLVEVLLGALLTAGMNYGWPSIKDTMRSWRDHLRSPSTSADQGLDS